jgi:hypothetical protein
MLEKLALLKIAFCKSPAVSCASCRKASVWRESVPVSSNVSFSFCSMCYFNVSVREMPHFSAALENQSWNQEKPRPYFFIEALWAQLGCAYVR